MTLSTDRLTFCPKPVLQASLSSSEERWRRRSKQPTTQWYGTASEATLWPRAALARGFSAVRAASTCVLRALPATRDLVRRTAVWKRGSRGTARGAPGALRRWPTPTVGLLGVYGTSIRTHYWMLSADFNMCLLSACMGDCTRLVAQLMVLWVKKSCSNVISGAGGRSAMHLTAIGTHSSDPDLWPPGSTAYRTGDRDAAPPRGAASAAGKCVMT